MTLARLAVALYAAHALSAFAPHAMPDRDWRTGPAPSLECHERPLCAGCHWRRR